MQKITSFMWFDNQAAESFNTGDTWALEKRSPENTTKTTLEQWVQEVLRKTFQEATL